MPLGLAPSSNRAFAPGRPSRGPLTGTAASSSADIVFGTSKMASVR